MMGVREALARFKYCLPLQPGLGPFPVLSVSPIDQIADRDKNSDRAGLRSMLSPWLSVTNRLTIAFPPTLIGLIEGNQTESVLLMGGGILIMGLLLSAAIVRWRARSAWFWLPIKPGLASHSDPHPPEWEGLGEWPYSDQSLPAMATTATLEASEQRWQFALEGSGDGIWDWNYQTGEVYYSRRWKAMLGYSDSEIGPNLREWEIRVHPDDLATVTTIMQTCFEGRTPQFVCEYRLRCKDGHYAWILDRGKVITWAESGQPLRIIGTHSDISLRKQAELALIAERDLFNSVMHTSVAAIVVLNPDGIIVFANDRAETVLGLTKPDLAQRRYNSPAWKHTALDGGSWTEAEQPFNQVISTGQSVYDIRHAIEWPNGQRRLLSINGAPVKDATGAIINLVFTVNDITDQVEAETALRKSEARFRLLAENMSDLVCLHNLDGTYQYVSPSCTTILGYEVAEMLHLSHHQLMHPDDVQNNGLLSCIAPVHHSPQRQIGSTEPQLPAIYRLRHQRGHYVWLETLTQPILDSQGQLVQVQTTSRDITEKLQIQAQLQHDALHDPLTGLPNRKQFLVRLNQALTASREHGTACAVLFLDLDRFKVINDSLGHQLGDTLLFDVAQKLSEVTGPDDFAARLGGDEFVVLLETVEGMERAVQVAERLLATFRTSFRVTDREVFITASIGIALSSSHYQEATELLRDADIAMYRAKSAGKGCYTIFDPPMHLQVIQEMHLESALRQAINHQDLVLYYQPIVALQTGQITGFEALVRWPHAERGLIAPAEFIPIAEETGLIIPLGNWVMATACEQFSQWQRQIPGVNTMQISINLSPVQLQDSHLLAHLNQVLQQTKLPPHSITLEITENLLVEDVTHNLAILDQIRQQQIHLNIDDFGTGYSSLSYLHQFPFTGLKVDRTFVLSLNHQAGNTGIIKTVLAMAQSLGLKAIAEGIETEYQLNFLRQHGCEFGQGYWFYPPLPADQAESLLWQDNSVV